VSRTDIARHEWGDGTRKLEATREEPRRYHQLLELHALVLDELRKRMGQTYSLEELVTCYAESDRWGREVLDDHAPVPAWPRDLTTVLAAAFDTFQRGAIDYKP